MRAEVFSSVLHFISTHISKEYFMKTSRTLAIAFAAAMAVAGTAYAQSAAQTDRGSAMPGNATGASNAGSATNNNPQGRAPTDPPSSTSSSTSGSSTYGNSGSGADSMARPMSDTSGRAPRRDRN
jgi:hypothetical protein